MVQKENPKTFSSPKQANSSSFPRRTIWRVSLSKKGKCQLLSEFRSIPSMPFIWCKYKIFCIANATIVPPLFSSPTISQLLFHAVSAMLKNNWDRTIFFVRINRTWSTSTTSKKSINQKTIPSCFLMIHKFQPPRENEKR